jgi:carnitine 3-dehydrogenase
MTDSEGIAAPAGAPLGAPATLIAREIPSAWIDYNGHVTESAYLELFGEATDALFPLIGVDDRYRESGGSYYTVETHLVHLRELFAGDRVHVTTQLLGADRVRLHLFHVLLRDGEDAPIATAEQMLVHVDTAAGRAAPARDDVRARVGLLVTEHAGLQRPEHAGRRIALP